VANELHIGHLIFLAHGDEGSDLLCHPDDPLDGDVSHVDHADQVARFRRTLLAVSIEKSILQLKTSFKPFYCLWLLQRRWGSFNRNF